jgi:hypothetical protein
MRNRRIALMHTRSAGAKVHLRSGRRSASGKLAVVQVGRVYAGEQAIPAPHESTFVRRLVYRAFAVEVTVIRELVPAEPGARVALVRDGDGARSRRPTTGTIRRAHWRPRRAVGASWIQD